MGYNNILGVEKKKNDGIINLIGELVRVSLYDLHNPLAKMRIPKANYSDRKRHEERVKIIKAKIAYNQAKYFFEESLLFELTGLNFEYINRKYIEEQKEKEKLKNGKCKSSRIKKSRSI